MAIFAGWHRVRAPRPRYPVARRRVQCLCPEIGSCCTVAPTSPVPTTTSQPRREAEEIHPTTTKLVDPSSLFLINREGQKSQKWCIFVIFQPLRCGGNFSLVIYSI